MMRSTIKVAKELLVGEDEMYKPNASAFCEDEVIRVKGKLFIYHKGMVCAYLERIPSGTIPIMRIRDFEIDEVIFDV